MERRISRANGGIALPRGCTVVPFYYIIYITLLTKNIITFTLRAVVDVVC